MNWAVIMAGGVGERFWPMSRRKRPKQLLPIVGKQTMIQQTVARLTGAVAPSRMIVVTNAEQAPLIRKQLPRVKHIVAEPAARNTAPCIALAAAVIRERDPDAVMVVVPADSYIPDAQHYRRVVSDALTLAGREKVLITIGIQPTSPHTGYGYIQLGERINDRFWKARRFVEKPDRATAEQFLASGEYRWNAGMFVWSLRAIGEAFQKYRPELWTDVRSLKCAYRKLEKISIDYAVMEKAGNVVVANGDFAWDDVGDWAAVERHGKQGGPDFVSVDSTGCVVAGEAGHTVAAVGVSDLVIVHTRDATLVCRKSDAQRVRELVKKLAGERKYRKLL
jgi:mannose-1-phosphate guanylyltransferase